MHLDRRHAAHILNHIARLLELTGDNPHRIRAFANAARAVAAVEGDLTALLEAGGILKVRGIGRGTAEVLSTLAAGGRPEILSRLESEIPAGVIEMLELEGLGPKKVRIIWSDLGVETLGELLYACTENRLLELPGFGPKMQLRVLQALRFHLRARERSLIHDANRAATHATEGLAKIAAVELITPLGELRRGADTVASLELLIVSSDEAATAAGLDEIADATSSELGLRWEMALDGGVRVAIRISNQQSAGAALVMGTGSEEHLRQLEQRLDPLGMRLGWNGLFQGDERLPSHREDEVYAAIGCPVIPPELREGQDELERAARGTLPSLVEANDLRGALHNHTTDSDGESSIEDMAAAAAALGWSFFGVADHSPVAVYANGVDAARLAEQGRRADAISAATGLPIHVFKGIEADILKDGSLDLPAGSEDRLDYVVASVHSAFRLPIEDQTARLVRAVAHPACRVLGHPTGRLLLARPGYELDLEAVLEACAKHGVAVEINASPYRLDLDWRWARRAIAKGVKLAVNADAHSTDGLEDLVWGLMIARKAGAEAKDLLNTMSTEELRAWLRR